MALNTRQRRAYGDIVALYSPDGPRGVADDTTFSLFATAVVCRFQATPETDEMRPPGRSKIANIFTLDRYFFEAKQAIADGWFIQLLTPGHPQYGLWWVVEGNAQVRADSGRRRPNYSLVFAKHATKPNGVA